MKTKIVISLLFGTIVSAAALYFALRNVPLKDLFNYLTTIDYTWILPSVVVILSAFALRAVRWQVILATTYKVDFFEAFHPLMIGFSINCILPGRVGEIARPVILSQQKGIAFTTILATVAVERVLDALTLIVMFALVILKVQPDPKFSMPFGDMELSRAVLVNIAAGTLKLCIVLIGAIVLISIDHIRKQFFAVMDWVPGKAAFLGAGFQSGLKKLNLKTQTIIDNFASGFSLIKNPKLLVLCLVFSIGIWLLSGFSYYLFSLGCPGINLSVGEIFAMMVIVCFAIALPSVPGYWGIWEAGGKFALSLFKVGAKEAAGYTLANHAIQIIPILAVGLISAWITSVDILKVSYRQANESELVDKISGPAREVINE
jgi:uncharacterized protein (TIRG00374 family)